MRVEEVQKKRGKKKESNGEGKKEKEKTKNQRASAYSLSPPQPCSETIVHRPVRGAMQVLCSLLTPNMQV
jgi:hypothetical protein